MQIYYWNVKEISERKKIACSFFPDWPGFIFTCLLDSLAIFVQVLQSFSYGN